MFYVWIQWIHVKSRARLGRNLASGPETSPVLWGALQDTITLLQVQMLWHFRLVHLMARLTLESQHQVQTPYLGVEISRCYTARTFLHQFNIKWTGFHIPSTTAKQQISLNIFTVFKENTESFHLFWTEDSQSHGLVTINNSCTLQISSRHLYLQEQRIRTSQTLSTAKEQNGCISYTLRGN